MRKPTILEAVLVTVIAAILAMWWQDRSQVASRQKDHEARLTAIEGRLVRHYPPDVQIPVHATPEPLIEARPMDASNRPTILPPAKSPNDH
jgi:hypothetical protein